MRNRVAAAFTCVGAAIAVAVAATCCGRIDVSGDFSSDASAPDARPQPPKADADGVVERPAWRGTIPFPGTWVPVPGIPAHCGVHVAVDAAASVSPFPWQPCPSGREGCQIFKTDWPYEDQHFDIGKSDRVWEADGHIHFAHRRNIFYSDRPSFQLSVVQPFHGAPEFALFTPFDGECMTEIHSSRYGLAAWTMAAPEAALTLGKLDDPLGLKTDLLTPSIGHVIFGQALSMGDGFLAFEGSDGSSILTGIHRSQGDKGPWFRWPEFGRSVDSEYPYATKDGYFAYVGGSPPTIQYVSLTGRSQVVVRPKPGSILRWFTVDRGSGDALVWQETVEGAAKTTDLGWFDESTVYTSPFATSEAGLVRRAVTKFPRPLPGSVNKGLFAVGLSEGVGRIVRLADGAGWDVQSEAGVPLMAGAWTNDEYVWFYRSYMAPGEPGYPRIGGMIRLARSGLGAPNVPTRP